MAVAGAGQVSSYHAVMPVMKVIKAAPELGDLPCSHGAVRPGNRVNKRLHACLLRLKSISPSVHEHDWSMCPATAGAAPPPPEQSSVLSPRPVLADLGSLDPTATRNPPNTMANYFSV